MVFLGLQMLVPTIPLYVTALGGDKTLAGLAIGLYAVSSLLVRPLAGLAMDAYGRRGILVGGMLTFLACVLAFNWVTALLPFLALRIVQGMGWGACGTAVGTIAADIISPARLGEGMGYYALASTLAIAIGPYVGLSVVQVGGFRGLFYLAALTVAVAIGLAFLLHYPAINRSSGPKNCAPYEAKAVPAAVILFFATMTYGAVASFVALYGTQQGIARIGLFFTVYAVAVALVRPISGRLADRRGFDAVIVGGLVCILVTMLILAQAAGLAAFLLAAALYGLGFGAVQPALQALAVVDVQPERRGAASGTFFTAFDLGSGLGSVLWGAVAQRLGFALMYLTAAIPALIALAAYLGYARLAFRHSH